MSDPDTIGESGPIPSSSNHDTSCEMENGNDETHDENESVRDANVNNAPIVGRDAELDQLETEEMNDVSNAQTKRIIVEKVSGRELNSKEIDLDLNLQNKDARHLSQSIVTDIDSHSVSNSELRENSLSLSTTQSENSISNLEPNVSEQKMELDGPDISDLDTNDSGLESSLFPDERQDGNQNGEIGQKQFNVESLSYELQVGYRILCNMMSASNRCVNKLFLHPVDDQFPETAEYYKKIKQPMWMLKMKEKYENNEYEDITDFMSDFRLMIENCYRFNGPDNFVSKKAQKLETMMKQKVALLSKNLRDKILGSVPASNDDDVLISAGLRRRVRNPNALESDPSQDLLTQLRKDRQIQERVDRRQKVEDRKAMEQARLQELQTWEDAMLGADIKDHIRTMWELPQIGLFVYLCMESLGLEEEVTQYQLERGLAVPRECSDFRRLMTCLLSTPHQRKNLKSFMPYHVWTEKLSAKLDYFYKVLSEKNGNHNQACYKLGLDLRAFKMMGKVNPMRKKKFHELSYLKRVWILKNFCDFCMETQQYLQKTIEDIEAVRPNDVREVLLGSDGRGYRYLNFPMFTGKDIRIFKHAKHAEPTLENLAMEDWTVESEKPSASSSRCSTPTSQRQSRYSETPANSLRARALLQAAESKESSPYGDISRAGSEPLNGNSTLPHQSHPISGDTSMPAAGKSALNAKKRKKSTIFTGKKKRLKVKKTSPVGVECVKPGQDGDGRSEEDSLNESLPLSSADNETSSKSSNLDCSTKAPLSSQNLSNGSPDIPPCDIVQSKELHAVNSKKAPPGLPVNANNVSHLHPKKNNLADGVTSKIDCAIDSADVDPQTKDNSRSIADAMPMDSAYLSCESDKSGRDEDEMTSVSKEEKNVRVGNGSCDNQNGNVQGNIEVNNIAQKERELEVKEEAKDIGKTLSSGLKKEFKRKIEVKEENFSEDDQSKSSESVHPIKPNGESEKTVMELSKDIKQNNESFPRKDLLLEDKNKTMSDCDESTVLAGGLCKSEVSDFVTEPKINGVGKQTLCTSPSSENVINNDCGDQKNAIVTAIKMETDPIDGDVVPASDNKECVDRSDTLGEAEKTLRTAKADDEKEAPSPGNLKTTVKELESPAEHAETSAQELEVPTVNPEITTPKIEALAENLETAAQEFEDSSDDEVDLPDRGCVELVAESMEEIRQLMNKLSNPEPIKRGKRVYPGVMKPCEEELLANVTRFHDELLKYERSLINARAGMQAKLRREVDSYVEPKLEQESKGWDSDHSQSTKDSSDAEDEKGEEVESKPSEIEPSRKSKRMKARQQVAATTSLLSSAASKLSAIGNDVGSNNNEDSNDSFELDISSRGRLRKRRIIPNNTEDTALKRRKLTESPLAGSSENSSASTSLSAAPASSKDLAVAVPSTSSAPVQRQMVGGKTWPSQIISMLTSGQAGLKGQQPRPVSGQVLQLVTPGNDSGGRVVRGLTPAPPGSVIISPHNLASIRLISSTGVLTLPRDRILSTGQAISLSCTSVSSPSTSTPAQASHPVIQQLLLNQNRQAGTTVKVSTQKANSLPASVLQQMQSSIQQQQQKAAGSSGSVGAKMSVVVTLPSTTASPISSTSLALPQASPVLVNSVSSSVSSGGKQVLDLGALSVTQIQQLVRNQAIQINFGGASGGPTTLLLTTGLQQLGAANSNPGALRAQLVNKTLAGVVASTAPQGARLHLQQAVAGSTATVVAVSSQPRTVRPTIPHSALTSTRVSPQQTVLRPGVPSFVTMINNRGQKILTTASSTGAPTISSIRPTQTSLTTAQIATTTSNSALKSALNYRSNLAQASSVGLAHRGPPPQPRIISSLSPATSTPVKDTQPKAPRIITVPLVHLSPNKKYAGNVTVKALLENRTPKKLDGEDSINKVGISGIVSSTPNVSATQVVENSVEKVVSTPVTKPLSVSTEVIIPTVNIKVPSPSTLPSVLHNKNGTTIVQSTKVPIAAASKAPDSTPTTSSLLSSKKPFVPDNGKALSNILSGVSSSYGTTASTAASVVVSSPPVAPSGLQAQQGVKNVMLKVTPQSSNLGQFVQGYMTPRGLVIPQSALLQQGKGLMLASSTALASQPHVLAAAQNPAVTSSTGTSTVLASQLQKSQMINSGGLKLMLVNPGVQSGQAAASASVIQQPSTQLLQQPTNILQQGTASLVQPQQQPTATNFVQQPTAVQVQHSIAPTMVQQPTTPSLVQQPAVANLVQQPNVTNLVQQSAAPNLVQQPTATNLVQQATVQNIMQQPTATNLVQQQNLLTSTPAAELVKQLAANTAQSGLVSPAIGATLNPRPAVVLGTPTNVRVAAPPTVVGSSNGGATIVSSGVQQVPLAGGQTVINSNQLAAQILALQQQQQQQQQVTGLAGQSTIQQQKTATPSVVTLQLQQLFSSLGGVSQLQSTNLQQHQQSQQPTAAGGVRLGTVQQQQQPAGQLVQLAVNPSQPFVAGSTGQVQQSHGVVLAQGSIIKLPSQQQSVVSSPAAALGIASAAAPNVLTSPVVPGQVKRIIRADTSNLVTVAKPPIIYAAGAANKAAQVLLAQHTNAVGIVKAENCNSMATSQQQPQQVSVKPGGSQTSAVEGMPKTFLYKVGDQYFSAVSAAPQLAQPAVVSSKQEVQLLVPPACIEASDKLLHSGSNYGSVSVASNGMQHPTNPRLQDNSASSNIKLFKQVLSVPTSGGDATAMSATGGDEEEAALNLLTLANQAVGQ